MVEVTTPQGTVLKGHSIRKAEVHGLREQALGQKPQNRDSFNNMAEAGCVHPSVCSLVSLPCRPHEVQLCLASWLTPVVSALEAEVGVYDRYGLQSDTWS